MTTLRVRVTAPEATAIRLFRLADKAFEDEGLPVTLFETVDSGPWTVEVLFFEEDEENAVARLADALGGEGEGLAISVEPVGEHNWVEESLKGLAPVSVGRFVVHGAHDRGHAAGTVPIEIDAGLAFGTGHHETTVGCLAAIEARLKRGPVRRPLDLGTGTGVLAIAIAKLCPARVVATDIDPVAVKITVENARLNGVGPRIVAFRATGMSDPRLAKGGFDFVVANILARPLVRLAPAIVRALAPKATVVLSGLRLDDGPRIVSAYCAQGLKLVHRDPRGRWLTLTFVR